MNYQQRWLLAVALKQAYPQPETGAAESSTITVAPPTFVVAEGEASADEQKAMQRKWLWTGLAIGAVGAVLIDRLIVHRMLRS